MLEQTKIYAYGRVSWLDKVLVVHLHIVDVVANGVADHFGGGEWRQQILYRRSGVACEPYVIRFRADDHGHPVMNRRQKLVGGCGDDRAGSDPTAVAFPTVPNTRESERRLVFHLKIIRLGDLSVPLPFVKTICGDEAASLFKRIAEDRLLFKCLCARVDKSFRLFAPEGNHAPAKEGGFFDGVTLEDRENILAGRDVVAWNKIVWIVSIESIEFYSLWCFKSKSAAHNSEAFRSMFV